MLQIWWNIERLGNRPDDIAIIVQTIRWNTWHNTCFNIVWLFCFFLCISYWFCCCFFSLHYFHFVLVRPVTSTAMSSLTSSFIFIDSIYQGDRHFQIEMQKFHRLETSTVNNRGEKNEKKRDEKIKAKLKIQCFYGVIICSKCWQSRSFCTMCNPFHFVPPRLSI